MRPHRVPPRIPEVLTLRELRGKSRDRVDMIELNRGWCSVVFFRVARASSAAMSEKEYHRNTLPPQQSNFRYQSLSLCSVTARDAVSTVFHCPPIVKTDEKIMCTGPGQGPDSNKGTKPHKQLA